MLPSLPIVYDSDVVSLLELLTNDSLSDVDVLLYPSSDLIRFLPLDFLEEYELVDAVGNEDFVDILQVPLDEVWLLKRIYVNQNSGTFTFSLVLIRDDSKVESRVLSNTASDTQYIEDLDFVRMDGGQYIRIYAIVTGKQKKRKSKTRIVTGKQ